MSIALMKKIIVAQVQPIVDVYVQWYSGEMHHNGLHPIDPAFVYNVEPGERSGEYYMTWTFTFAEDTHTVKALIAHHECSLLEITLGRPDYYFNMVDAQEVIARFIAELYGQINAWAVANDCRPENMMH